MLINCMEAIVEEALEEFLNKNLDLKETLTEEDLLDIKVFSLNNLPPYYSTSQRGYAFNKIKCMDIQSKINIVKIVVQGAEDVLSKKSGQNLNRMMDKVYIE